MTSGEWMQTTHPRQPYYIYECQLKRVIDGDTIELVVRLGFSVQANITIRMAGYNAPELFRGDAIEKAKGLDAKRKLESLLEGYELLVMTKKVSGHKDQKGKYGRYIGTVFHRDVDLNVNESMISYLQDIV